MSYDPFVLPFSIGLVIVIILILWKYFRWVFFHENSERIQILKTIFSLRIFSIVKEIFMEVLLHRRIFRINPVLGYMHSSFAFGWFLLILGGTIESKLHNHNAFNMFYEPIFFKFFSHNIDGFPFAAGFKFIMDFILLYILSGLVLAMAKRIYKRMFGMKRTTKLRLVDRLALTSLWCIFPLRLLAESLTSAQYQNGGFLTGKFGNFLATFLPVNQLEYPAWWAYSIALGVFFVMLPYSRYMHIPTEMVLIILRKAGFKTEKKYTGFSRVEVQSCSRCGICLDACQVYSETQRNKMLPAYFLQSVRFNKKGKQGLTDCLMCGRCQEVCPVGIGVNAIRRVKRNELFDEKGAEFGYLEETKPITKKTDVIYFAGCMTHLTPTIKKSMIALLKKAEINFWFMDEDASICCGRPLQLSGKEKDANILADKNRELIANSGAELLVTSCPICYKIFKEDYKLNIKVKHHTEYLNELVNIGKLKPANLNFSSVYHDPCDLGRGSGIYNQPRELLGKISVLNKTESEKNMALCCGNSLANLPAGFDDKELMAISAAEQLCVSNPDKLITACPLCKKTFVQACNEKKTGRQVEVKDIAEVLAEAVNY